MAVFWVVAPCSLVEIYRRFRGVAASIALMTEVASTSETLVNFYQTAQRKNPEDSHLRHVFSSKASFSTLTSPHTAYRSELCYTQYKIWVLRYHNLKSVASSIREFQVSYCAIILRLILANPVIRLEIVLIFVIRSTC
jgi:hypothetical protein